MCVYSRTLPSALCANAGLKSPLHCAGSFPREKAIDSVSSEWIEADSKRGFGRGRKQASPSLQPPYPPPTPPPTTPTSPRLTHPSLNSQCLFGF